MTMDCRTTLILSFVALSVGDKELRLLGLQAMTGEAWPGGWACLVPVQMAIDRINKDDRLLKGFNLTYDYIDHECISGSAVFKMVDKLYNGPQYIMVTGPILSLIATSTAEVSYHWNLTQLGFAAGSPVLSDRQRFPRFYRLGPPDRKLNPARIGLMKTFDWNKIATLHHAIEYFSMTMDDIVADIRAENITIISQQVFLNDPLTQIQNLKEHDARIIITAMYEDRARALLCSAYKVGLYGPKIVWILLGFYSTKFWLTQQADVDCTPEQMTVAIEGMFLITFAAKNPVEERGLANLTFSEFTEAFRSHPKYNPATSMFDLLGKKCFDGIYVSALALNCTDTILKDIGYNKTLDQFTYADSFINDIIYECVGKTNFVGVAATIKFDKNGDLDETTQIDRIQNGEHTIVAYYTDEQFRWMENGLIWKDGKVPRDSTIVIEKETTIPITMYVLMSTFAGIGILLAIFFFVFNIVYRKNGVVKMSSPNINNVLLLGCIVCYTTVFIKTLGLSSAVICTLRSFCFTLGFTITFGSLFSKTWRVYRIFTNKKLMRMSIKDSQLFAINGALALVVLLVLVVWQLLAPHEVTIKMLYKEVYSVGNDEEIRPYVRVCYSSLSNYISWVIYVLEGALLAFGAFLAWETRHVTIAALNDSRQIGMCLYNVVILSAVGLTLTLLLGDHDVMMYGVTSGCLIIGTTLTQMVVFVPKVYAVYNKVECVEAKTCSMPATSSFVKSVDLSVNTRTAFD